MYQEKEGDSNDFFSYVFLRSAPLPKQSVQMQCMDEEQTYQTRDEYLKEMFHCLLTFFTRYMQYRFGNSQGQVDLDQLGPQHISKLNEYFESFGYTLHIEVFQDRQAFLDWDKDQSQTSEPSLSDYFLNFQTRTRYYHLHFSEC
jgi:hypothetical protein